MKSEAAEQFDKLASLYEDMFTWPFRHYFEAPTVLEVVGDLKGGSVLDFGSGGGGYTRLLKERGAGEVVGYEPTAGMCDYARRRAAKEGVDVRYVTELAPELTARFDLLLSIYVIPYATNPAELDAMCAEMAAPIRPGGRFVAVTINPEFYPAPEYYERYGLRFTPDDPQKAPYSNCSRLRLDLNYHGYTGSVHAWYWKRPAIEQALNRAGIGSVRWHELRAPAYPNIADMPEELRPYQQRPHAVVIEGKRQ